MFLLVIVVPWACWTDAAVMEELAQRQLCHAQQEEDLAQRQLQLQQVARVEPVERHVRCGSLEARWCVRFLWW